jgi:MFS family permease
MNNIEKKTFSLHLIYTLIDGCLKGCFIMNEFIFLRSMKGSHYQVGVLFQLSMVLLLLSIVFNQILKRSKKKQRLLMTTAIICHLPLLFTFFFPSVADPYSSSFTFQWLYLGIFFMYYLSTPLVLPTINLLLKNTYSQTNFGRLYGITSSAGKVTMLLSTFAFGIFLDSDNFAFRYVYPFLGLMGIGAVTALAFIPYKSEIEEVVNNGFWSSVKDSFYRMLTIIRTNTAFRHFEMGFMLYGFSFLCTSAVITIFLEDYLKLNYSSVAFYKNIFNILSILIMPLFGKILNKMDPRRFALITFGSLGLYIFFIGCTEYFPTHFTYMNIEIYAFLMLAMLAYGIFQGTMPLLWNIGSSYFCKSKDAGDYQSIHLSLTGARGVFAPLMGIFFYETLGYTGTWAIAIFSILMALALMIYSVRKS